MSAVAQSEAELLTLARALVGQVDVEGAGTLLRTARPPAEKLGPTSMALLQQTLAAGSVLQLARRGGWRRRRYLDGGKVVAGRLWERHPAIDLRFSPASMNLCRWLLATPMSLPRVPPLPIEGELTLADELLHYLACDLLVRSGCPDAIDDAGVFAYSPLCWLGFFPELMGKRSGKQRPSPPRVRSWIESGGALLLEAMQDDLAARWLDTERSKHLIEDCASLIALGERQQWVLDALLDALEATERQDLARFLLAAGAPLLFEGVSASHWCQSLDPRRPLAERAHARRAAGVFLRSLGRIQGWAERWRLTPFFEDGYATAQALLAEWETFGDEAYRRAQGVLQALGSIDAQASAAQGSES